MMHTEIGVMHSSVFRWSVPVRASEQGNVIRLVSVYIYIRLITRVSVEYDEIFHE